MSLFRTLAGAVIDGATPALVASSLVSGVARTVGQAHGSWDITFPAELPHAKVGVKITAMSTGLGHNLTPDYDWPANDGNVLRVTLRDDAAALTDATFALLIQRVSL
jgi:hypothetical protein